MAELWTLLTENPATFKGGGIWRIMTNINDALTAIAYGLLAVSYTHLGDNQKIWAFVLLALASAGTATGVTVYRRKKSKMTDNKKETEEK